MITRRSLLNAVTALFIILSFKLALAAIPPGLNYQGHLTDSNGVPIDGQVNMVFAIYDIDAGGTALWSDTRSVTIDQGVFSIELGGSSNPFPPGLFENPLWMGLSVGADAEMSPRRPISSVGFSFKADDANTLEGVNASTLDQSAHVIDTANPHGVTAAQAGAADAAILSAHTGNVSNPHSVSAAQAGAATSTDFTTHTSNNAAHHSRYTNTEAVNAMGAKNDRNALNHDRYTDEHVVAAMLANDGTGSTLDSDKVDGFEASELIDAAQDEVRTPISSLPYTINASGAYYLTGNLDGSSGGINITADNVTLDLMGFSIDGGAVSDYGIDFYGRSNVTIKNGYITNFGYAGISQGYSAARYATVIDVQVHGNGTLTLNAHSGLYIIGGSSHIERCSAGNNAGSGIYAGNSARLINNTASHNGHYGIYVALGSTLSGNVASNNADTGIFAGTNSTLNANTAYDNANSGIMGSTGATLSKNAAYSNTGSYGIYGGTGAILTGNTAYNNTCTYGIYGSAGANISDNAAYSNNGTYGIYGSSGASLIRNTAYSNSHWGIAGGGSNLVKDNNVYFNNTSNTINEGGMRVGGDSRVLGNALDSNYRINLSVVTGDNAIIDNLVTDSTYGIHFSGSVNYWRDNMASNNTYNYGGTIPAGGYDGGGNVSF